VQICITTESSTMVIARNAPRLIIALRRIRASFAVFNSFVINLLFRSLFLTWRYLALLCFVFNSRLFIRRISFGIARRRISRACFHRDAFLSAAIHRRISRASHTLSEDLRSVATRRYPSCCLQRNRTPSKGDGIRHRTP